MTVSCFYCQETCGDYAKLALHIATSKKGHRKGKRWAAKYMFINGLSPAKRFERRRGSPLTAKDLENRERARLILSGVVKTVPTVCPTCHKENRQALPIEHVESETAWRTKSGTLMVNCLNCQKVKRYN